MTRTDIIETHSSSQEAALVERNAMLRDKKIDRAIIRKAWFTMAHMLLPDEAHVVDMGCGDGDMTFVMAALYPNLRFTGLDKDKRKINKAMARFHLDNLEFKIGDVSSTVFGKESVDAIVNSYILHEVYSGSRYDEQVVSQTLATHHAMLKKGGQLMIRDYARPPPEAFVLMEMPDKPSKSDALKDLSEADLLVWYAEHARPKNDPGCGGFFLEELPAQFPGTRLFRLPYKWAYEFIMRKDDRSHWETELPMEYTFFTRREMRRSLSALGMRVQYAAPHWDEDIIRDHFEGKFRLYDDRGNPMDFPPVCYIAVATKLADRKSLQILERRPSQKEQSRIQITTLRNNETGKLLDVAKRDMDLDEVIPYRIAESGRLKIYLHDGLARSITNAVPRSGSNLGDQRWSGHMIEAVSVERSHLPKSNEIDFKNSVLFARDYLGLKPENGKLLEIGPDYYPSPDYIDERIQTYYLNVSPPRQAIKPLKALSFTQRFQAKGDVREFDAQQVLDAIGVGMIPNARLEMQILVLFQHTGVKAENWVRSQIQFEIGKVMNKQSLRTAIENLKISDTLFREVKGSANELRRVHSIFVEEGQSQGATAGLSFEDVDFVFHNHETVNVAVVLPLTKDIKTGVHAAVQVEQLPVPMRHEGKTTTLSAPRISLPPEITNLRLAKKYLAKHFAVLPDNVIKMGEPYFTHIGLTPQKIHPFAVVVPHDTLKNPGTVIMPFYQLTLIGMNRSFLKSSHFMTLIGRSYRYLHDELKFDAKASAKFIASQQFAYKTPTFTMPLEYARGPSLPDVVESNSPKPAIISPPLKSIKEVTLKEDIAPSFGEAVPPKASPMKDMIKPLLSKVKPKDAPDMAHDFEKELEDFIEDVSAIEEINRPRPERW
jgi:ubiquinone/menaquinone biosynthesis C-methylase UbiE